MILLTGGVKSGKSTYALRLSQKYTKKAFIATAEPFDDEMKIRIKKHKSERDISFTTFEEPLEISSVIRSISNDYDVIIVECLTTWLSNVMYYKKDTEKYIEDFISPLSGKEIIVTNEVGLGIIPSDLLSRKYVDYIGYLNSRTAAKSDEVYLMVSGIPVKIK